MPRRNKQEKLRKASWYPDPEILVGRKVMRIMLNSSMIEIDLKKETVKRLVNDEPWVKR